VDPQKELRRVDAIDPRSDILLVSEALAPGQARLTGVHFFRPNGELSETGRRLDRFLNEFGRTIYPSSEVRLKSGAVVPASRPEFIAVYNSEAVQCFPGRKPAGAIRAPTSSQISKCQEMGFLAEELQLIKPRLVLLHGRKGRDAIFKYHLRKPCPRNLTDHITHIINEKEIPRFTLYGLDLFVLPTIHSSPMAGGDFSIMDDPHPHQNDKGGSALRAEHLKRMFELVGLSQDELHSALRSLGPKISYAPKRWTPERPTIGCCAVVSSTVYCYYKLVEGVIPIYLKTETGSHWFLGFPPDKVRDLRKDNRKYVVANIRLGKGKHADYVIVDLTADQVDDYPDYSRGVRRAFQFASPSLPSIRAQKLAGALGRQAVYRVGHRAWWK